MRDHPADGFSPSNEGSALDYFALGIGSVRRAPPPVRAPADVDGLASGFIADRWCIR
jgi:hypothetical protein